MYIYMYICIHIYIYIYYIMSTGLRIQSLDIEGVRFAQGHPPLVNN